MRVTKYRCRLQSFDAGFVGLFYGVFGLILRIVSGVCARMIHRDYWFKCRRVGIERLVLNI